MRRRQQRLPPAAEPVEIPPAAGDDLHRTHVRGSAMLVLGRGVALLLGMATQVLIVRALTKEDFGAFAIAIVLAAGARILLSLGQGRSLSRFMAMYEEQRDYPRMFGAMALAFGTVLVTSILFIAVLFLFGDALVGGAVDEGALTLVLILAFLSPLEALDQVFLSLFAVFSKPRAIFFRKHLMTPGLRLVVVVTILYVLDAGVAPLAVGYVLAGLVGVGLYVGLLVRVLRERGLLARLRPRELVLPFRAVFGFSIPLITGELTLLSMTLGSVIVLAAFHSAAEVANYRAVFSAARLNTAVSTTFVTLFLPVLTRFHTRGDLDGVRRSYWHTAAFVAVATFPIFALTGPLAPATTVTLFGERYAGSAAVCTLLAVGYYLGVVLGFNNYALQVCGRIRFLVVVNVAVAAANIALCLLLAERFGAVGVAAANSIALIAQNVVTQLVLRGSIGTGFIDRSVLRAYAAIAVGAGVLWSLQVLFSPTMVGSLVAATLVSLAVLFVSRSALRLSETFPEIARVPLVGRLFG